MLCISVLTCAMPSYPNQSNSKSIVSTLFPLLSDKPGRQSLLNEALIKCAPNNSIQVNMMPIYALINMLLCVHKLISTNILAIQLILSCVQCPKGCVQYAKMKIRTVNCDVNNRIIGHLMPSN